MSRTITEIKQEIASAFIAQNEVIERYGLESGKSFEDQFSKASIESILFYVIAVAIWSLEQLFDLLRQEVEEKIYQTPVYSVGWYYQIAKSFQHGDALIFNSQTQRFEYQRENPEKRLIKYVAVNDKETYIDVLVSGDTGGGPSRLDGGVLYAFKEYMKKQKPPGILLRIDSKAPDSIRITATIKADPLLLKADGSLIAGGSFPIRQAIQDYLKNIAYGGTFNKTKLIDAIQEVPGVLDVMLGECLVKPEGGNYTEITANSYTAAGGAFIAENLENSLTYEI